MKSLILPVAPGLIFALVALAFTGSASATVLCPQNQNPCEFEKPSGTSLAGKLIYETGLILRTPYGQQGCLASSMSSKTTNTGGSGEAITGNLGLSNGFCTCGLKVLKNGTFKVQQVEGTANGTVTSSGLELTTSCTIESKTVHCIYATENTNFGTLKGGNPAIWQVSAVIPTLATGATCGESGELLAEYEITIPKPLYVESSAEPVSALLCTEAANPCGSHKPSGTVLEGKLAFESPLRMIYGFMYSEELICAESSLRAKTTNTGSSTERLEGEVVSLSLGSCEWRERSGIELRAKCTTVVTLEPGTFTIAGNESAGNGRLSLNKTELTTRCPFESSEHCKFRAEYATVGKITGGNPATIDLQGTLSPVTANPLCGPGEIISGTYEVTSPNPLYIEPG